MIGAFSAALSIRLTRLKPRDPPRAGTHQKQRPIQPFRGKVMPRGPLDVRSLEALPWVNTAVGAFHFECSIRFIKIHATLFS